MPRISADARDASNPAIRKLASGATVAFLGGGIGRALRTLNQVIVARLLGPAMYGLYAIGWTGFQIISILCQLGLDKAVLYFIPKEQKEKARLKGILVQSLVLATVAGLAVGGLCFVGSPWLAVLGFGKPELTSVLRGFSLALPFAAGMRVASAATRSTQRMIFSVVGEVVGEPATIIVTFLCLYLLGGRLLSAVCSVVAADVIAVCLLLYFLWLLFRGVFSLNLIMAPMSAELIAFGLPSSFIDSLMMLTTCADRLLVGHFRPASEVGIYQAAVQISVIFSFLQATIAAMFSSMIADLHHRQQKHLLNELFRVSTKWGIYACTPIFLIVCFAAPQLLYVTYGHKYVAGAPLLIVLALGQLINAATGAVGFMLVLTGHQKQLLKIASSSLAVCLVANVFLIPRFGLIGAAVASSLSTALLFSSALWAVRRRLDLWPYDGRSLKGLVAAAVTVLGLLATTRIGMSSASAILLLRGAIAFTGFGFCLFALGLDREDHEMLRVVRERLGNIRPGADPGTAD